MIKTSASTHTGGGLWDIGIRMAGFKPVWGVEYDPNKCKVAMKNIPGFTVLCYDVAAVDYTLLPRVYHLHSSPSCINASIANTNQGETETDIKNAQAICRAIRDVGPRCFTLENVWAYRKFDSFKLIIRTLHDLAYSLDWWHLNAANYGVPQTRKRLILAASMDKQPRKPIPTHSKQVDTFGIYKPWVSWYEAIEDLLPDMQDTELAPWQIERLPESLSNSLLIEPSKMRDGGLQIKSGSPACTIKASRHTNFRAILIDGANASHLTTRPAQSPSFTTTAFYHKNAMRALLIPDQKTTLPRKDTLSVFTIRVSGNPPKAILPHRVVKISLRGLARFQSVPDSYQLPVNNRLAGEIIGNGVPPLLAKKIVESL